MFLGPVEGRPTKAEASFRVLFQINEGDNHLCLLLENSAFSKNPKDQLIVSVKLSPDTKFFAKRLRITV